MSTEFQINGQTYKAGKLDAFKQFHIVRRLAPLLAGMSDVLRGGPTAAMARLKEDPLGAALPIIECLGKMPDDEANYVITSCLSVVQRQQAQIGWANLTSSQGDLMFEDIGMPEMLQITWKVLESNVMGFSGAIQGLLSQGQAAAQQ